MEPSASVAHCARGDDEPFKFWVDKNNWSGSKPMERRAVCGSEVFRFEEKNLVTMIRAIWQPSGGYHTNAAFAEELSTVEINQILDEVGSSREVLADSEKSVTGKRKACKELLNVFRDQNVVDVRLAIVDIMMQHPDFFKSASKVLIATLQNVDQALSETHRELTIAILQLLAIIGGKSSNDFQILKELQNKAEEVSDRRVCYSMEAAISSYQGK
jgi:hypothetical protein